MEQSNCKTVIVIACELIILIMIAIISLNCGDVVSPFGATNSLGHEVTEDMQWADEPADVSTATWKPGGDSDIAFKLPEGWQMERQTFESDSPVIKRIVLKDTDKLVVFGAIAPEDYYDETRDSGVLNSSYYAEAYTAVTVTIYDDSGHMNWRAFFDLAEPDAVAEFEPVTLDFRPDLEVVRVTEVSGVFCGDARIFVRTGGKICDIALDYRYRDRTQELAFFKAFLSEFNR